MDKRGRLNVGADYQPQIERLCELLGVAKPRDALRTVVDEVLADAEAKNLKSISRRIIGIKPHSPPGLKQKRRRKP